MNKSEQKTKENSISSEPYVFYNVIIQFLLPMWNVCEVKKQL